MIPFRLSLKECEIAAKALIPQLGSRKGMIIVSNFADLCGRANALIDMGFGYSVLDEPRADEEYDLDSHIEMFSEWGWASEEAKPEWLLDQEE